MNKKYKDYKLRLHFVLLGFILFSTFFLSIGYASLNSITLDITGEVTAIPQSEIYITDVQYQTNIGSNPENSTIKQYYQTLMESSIALGNSPTSSITYSITIYNSGNETYTFKEVEYSDKFYDNPNIVFELNGLKQWDPLASKQSVTFTITFHYLNNTLPDNKILNSYLNFKFIKGTLDDTNIITTNKKTTIYNAATQNVQFDVTNNNDFAANINLKLGDVVLQTLALEPSQTVSINTNIKEHLGSLQASQEYSILVEQTAPYTVSKKTASKVQVIPTLTNYDFGLKSAGSEQNPYILYKIEDLVRFAQNVKNGTTFDGNYLKLITNLDFKDPTNYYNSQDTSFGNLNDIEDTNELLTEMTTGAGFIVIGTEGKSFQGTLDGNNHTISNLYIDRRQKTVTIPCGLFSVIDHATIKNLSLSGEYFFKRDGGGFAGDIYGTTTLSNCHNHVAINNIAQNKSIGGLLGTIQSSANVTITNCSNHGHITNNSGSAAGLVGLNISSTVTIIDSFNAGNISVLGTFGGDQFASGLIVKDNSSGNATIIIRKSYNIGEITCKRNRTG